MRPLLHLVVLALALPLVARAQVPPPWEPAGLSSPVTLADGTQVVGSVYVDASTGARGLGFLGIPFAEPPVGALRWRMPVAWSGGGPGVSLNATTLPPACPQLGSAISPGVSDNEDCLYLNVYMPASRSTHGPMPVMVFIYGGAFVSGSSALPTYTGFPLVTREEVVLVTMNYRVGPFGFFALPELQAESGVGTTGNTGLQDQRLALQWVAANAAAFGGDPSAVTLFGESAGAISACVHFVSPHSAGLFARVIQESSDCNLTFALPAAFAQGAAITAALGCTGSSEDTLTCLRAAPASAVLSALLPGAVGEPGGAHYAPVLDGYELTMSPSAMVATGAVAPAALVPSIVGTNLNEATLFVMTNATLAGMDAAALAALVAQTFGAAAAPHVLAQYPLSQFALAPPGEAWAAILSDFIFKCPTWFMANALAAANVTVLRYNMAYVPECGLFPPAYAPLFGVYHFADVPYVFGVAPAGCNFTASDTEVSHTFQSMWGEMARGRAPWPLYDAAKTMVVIDVPMGLETDYDSDNCDFWMRTLPNPDATRRELRAKLVW